MDKEQLGKLYQVLHDELFDSLVHASNADNHQIMWKVWQVAFETGVRFTMGYPRLAMQIRDQWLEKPGEPDYTAMSVKLITSVDRFAGGVRDELAPIKQVRGAELEARLAKVKMEALAGLDSVSPAFDKKTGELVWVPVRTPFVDGPMDYLPEWGADA